jgi:hypothetical protein
METKHAEWCDLLSAAKRAGLGDEFLRELRWSTLAPLELHDFRDLLSKLRGILKCAEKAWPGVLNDLGISSWPAKLKKLDRQIMPLTFPHIPLEQRHIATAGDKSGVRTGHAIYSDLLALPDEDSVYADSCRLLMAHTFLAHLRILHIPAGTELSKDLINGDTSIEAYEAYTGREPWPALTVSPYHVGLALRGLFSGDDWARAMMELFPVTDTLVFFAGCPDFNIASVASVSGKSPKWLEEKRDCVRRYLAQAWGIKLRHKGHGRPVDPDLQDPAYRFDECPDEDEEEDQEEGREEEGKGEESGEEEGDGPPDQQNGNGGSGQNRRGKKRKARRANRATQRRHGSSAGAGTDQAILAGKFLANAKDRLSPSELVVLDVNARREFGRIMVKLKSHDHDVKDLVDSLRSPDDQALIEHAECILFALVMLWTASSIDRTKDLRVTGSQAYMGANAFTMVMDRNGNGRDAIIRILTNWPEDAPRRGPMPLDRNRTEDVRLKDPAGLGPMVWEFATTVYGNPPGFGVAPVFRKDLEFYSHGVTKLLEGLDPTGRLTPARLQSYFYDELMSWTGRDSSAATIITGNLRDAARVQMFYAVRREKRMQEIQKGTVNNARNRINLASMPRVSAEQARLQLALLTEGTRRTEPRSKYEPIPDNEIYIGINACPTDAEMQRAVQTLIDKLRGPWQLNDSNQWNEYFNLYTFYTIWFFGFVVGSRAIECPYLWLHEIDPVGLTARYQEKGPRKARLVWLLPKLFEQMQNYAAFLRSTRLSKLTKYPCWLLDKKGKSIVVEPSTYEEYVHQFLPGYPTNIARRYMFNALLDSGCPVVPEWCGQFHTGNQLTGRSGTASPHQFGTEIRRYVEPIIEYLGFRPIKGKTI